MQAERKRLTADDFWRRVDKRPGCWVWTGPLDGRGQQGYTCLDGMREKAQRIAWRLVKDSGLDEQTQIRRMCPTPLCVHPDHHRAVGPDYVAEVMSLRADGLKQEEIARRFGVSRSAIAQALRKAARA